MPSLSDIFASDDQQEPGAESMPTADEPGSETDTTASDSAGDGEARTDTGGVVTTVPDDWQDA
jgi:hypothetical protein